ncbi:MAG: DUF4124 domain-containing protein [Gammaproteobacteria bacterium]|nr:MAG: DUF4124 domain-containing protein [Gammaproteobacteria bacterium]
MSRLLPIIALILAGALTVARADVYRWTDEQGVTHYSDQWVPGSVLIKTVKPHPVTFDSSARSAEQKSLTAGNNRVSSELSDQANAAGCRQGARSPVQERQGALHAGDPVPPRVQGGQERRARISFGRCSRRLSRAGAQGRAGPVRQRAGVRT